MLVLLNQFTSLSHILLCAFLGSFLVINRNKIEKVCEDLEKHLKKQKQISQTVSKVDFVLVGLARFRAGLKNDEATEMNCT